MADISTTTESTLSLIDDYIAELSGKPTASAGSGSLVFALDATGSREPTWDLAVDLQARMFSEVAALGGLAVKLVYFGGTGRDAACRASEWISEPRRLAAFMNGIKCRAGVTQIGKTLDHTIREASQRKVGALIFIGDAAEEPPSLLMPKARRLAELGIPAFLFQEGRDVEAEMIFREIARLTGGAYQKFDQGSARQLGELLRAAALFATGGRAALEGQNSETAKLLLGQLR